MNVTSLVWYFTNALHDVDDKKYKDLKVTRKVAILNRALHIFFDKILSNRSKNAVFDEWLRPLEVDDYVLKVIKKTDEFYLYEYPERFAVATYSKIDAKKGKCEASFEAHPIMDKSAGNAISNPFWQPSFEFEHTFRTKNREGIKIWRKDFDIVKAYISYLQRPPDVHAPSLNEITGSYIYHDNKKYSKDVDLLLGEGAHVPLVDIAVLIATDSGGDFNLQVNKILNIKQI